jgi:hypothetical protein
LTAKNLSHEHLQLKYLANRTITIGHHDQDGCFSFYLSNQTVAEAKQAVSAASIQNSALSDEEF